jgi:hypothetical protein
MRPLFSLPVLVYSTGSWRIRTRSCVITTMAPDVRLSSMSGIDARIAAA